ATVRSCEPASATTTWSATPATDRRALARCSSWLRVNRQTVKDMASPHRDHGPGRNAYDCKGSNPPREGGWRRRNGPGRTKTGSAGTTRKPRCPEQTPGPPPALTATEWRVFLFRPGGRRPADGGGAGLRGAAAPSPTGAGGGKR